MGNRYVQRLMECYAAIGREFARNCKRHRRLLQSRMQCRRGCTDCCHHIFHLTEVEAAQVSRDVKSLPPETRQKLVENARAYLPKRDEVMRRHGFIQAWGNLPRPETRLACPALVGGACTIYDHRPLICRKFGMPIYHPEQPARIFACELNFRPGEAFEDPHLVRIQTGLAEAWTGLQSDYDRDGGKRDELPISVAHAILKDYEGHLPR